MAWGNAFGVHMPSVSFNRLFRRAIPLLAMLAFSAWFAAAWAQDNSLRQTGINVDATAADAVQARDRALAQGRRDAFNRLAAAVGTTPPNFSDSQLERMTASMLIEQERVTSTRYTGRITVVFNGGARSALGSGVQGAGPAAGNINPMAGQPATNFVEATTTFGSLRGWTDLRRRMLGAGPIATVDILAISTDGARLRLGLRLPAPEAVNSLAANGVVLAPPGPAGEPWRIGLGGG